MPSRSRRTTPPRQRMCVERWLAALPQVTNIKPLSSVSQRYASTPPPLLNANSISQTHAADDDDGDHHRHQVLPFDARGWSIFFAASRMGVTCVGRRRTARQPLLVSSGE